MAINRTNMPMWAFVVLGLMVAVSGRPKKLFVSPKIHVRTDAPKWCTGPGHHYHRSVCYIYNSTLLDWNQASDVCVGLGGELVQMHKPSVISTIRTCLSKDWAAEKIWVGSAHVGREDMKVSFWLDGERVTEDDLWRNATRLEHEDCVLFHKSDLKFDYEKCSGKSDFVCEVLVTKDCNAAKLLNKRREKRIKSRTNMQEDMFNKILQLNKKSKLDAKCTGGMHEGDICLTQRQRESIGKKGSPIFSRHKAEKIANLLTTPSTREEGEKILRRTRRNVMHSQWHDDALWPDFVPYVFDTVNPVANRAMAEEAMRIIETETNGCVKFVPWIQAEHEAVTQTFLNITAAYPGCWSYVGRFGSFGLAGQEINLEPGCFYSVTTLLHELLHALGFYHEQSRWDRDDYVTLHIENINPDYLSQFEKIQESSGDMELVKGYDYKSLMHYSWNAFAINTSLPTITPIVSDPDIVLGAVRNGLSDIDRAEIDVIYKCRLPIDGGWSEWTVWTPCTQTCGGGVSERTRTCNNPEPRNGGSPCSGSTTETRACKTDACPTNEYRWMGLFVDVGLPDLLDTLENTTTELSDNYLNRTQKIMKCSYAVQAVGAEIFALKFGGKCLVQHKTDSPTLYKHFGPSDKTSDGYGDIDAIDVYRVGAGPVDGGWSVWGTYTPCSVSCGGGIKTHTRKCDNPAPSDGGENCVGVSSENAGCNTEDCPLPIYWSEWGQWSACNEKCGSESRSRTRSCVNGEVDPCEGGTTAAFQMQSCDLPACTTTPPPTTTTTTTTIAPTTPGSVNPAQALIDEAYLYYPMESKEGNEILGVNSPSVTGEGPTAPAIADGRQDNALLLENRAYLDGSTGSDARVPLCLSDPMLCTDGLTVSMWLRQTHEQRYGNIETRPHTIFSTGVEAEEAETPKQGLGLAFYITRYGLLKVFLRTAEKEFAVDIPPYILNKVGVWHHVAATWSATKGLTIYSKGTAYNWDFDGRDNQDNKNVTFTYFTMGRPIQCNDHFYQGYIDELFIWQRLLSDAEIYKIFTSVPKSCVDCDQKAICDDSTQTCTCVSGYEGDGFYCDKIVVPDYNSGISLPTPTYYWPMNKIHQNNVEGNAALFVGEDMLVSNGILGNAVVFNGRRDWLNAGDVSGTCLSDLTSCTSGFTIAFYVSYQGRGNRPNYILSSGADDTAAGTGIAMWVMGTTAVVRARSETSTYEISLDMDRNTWTYFVLRWSVNTHLTVLRDGEPVSNQVTQSDSPDGTQPLDGAVLSIGKPSTVFVWNARMIMDNLAIWEKSLSDEEIAVLYETGVHGQSSYRR